MKRASYRYVLPTLLLGLHALLLLPVLLAKPHVDAAKRPPPRVHLELGDGAEEPEETLWERLHTQYSMPLGVGGFVIIHAVKQLMGMIPLPTDPRRRKLARFIEHAVLFGSGCLEEVWRWGVVRILVKLEGGSGGFRGRGELWDLNTKYPSIWEGVYLLGWTWSLVEAGMSWWSLRPLPSDPPRESPGYQSPIISPCSPGHSPNSPRRPLLGKRTRSDYSGILSDTDGDHRRSGHFGSFSTRKKQDLGSHRPKLDFLTTTHQPTISFASSPDIEPGHLDHTPTQRNYGSRPSTSGSHHDGDDEGSIISTYSLSTTDPHDDTNTPLLSSSLPYNPSMDHPHIDTTANLSDTATPPSPSLISVHEDDDAPPSPIDGPRLYPSFPSYSTSYNHTYFPTSSPASTPGPPPSPPPPPPRLVYGHELATLPVYLPVIWRCSAATRHIANALFFAWAPNLVFMGRFQWWAAVVVVVLAVKKGWNSIEFFGGVAQRRGIRRASLVTCVLNLVVLAAAGKVWDVWG